MESSRSSSLLKIGVKDLDVTRVAEARFDRQNNSGGYITVLIALGNVLNTKSRVEV